MESTVVHPPWPACIKKQLCLQFTIRSNHADRLAYLPLRSCIYNACPSCQVMPLLLVSRYHTITDHICIISPIVKSSVKEDCPHYADLVLFLLLCILNCVECQIIILHEAQDVMAKFKVIWTMHNIWTTSDLASSTIVTQKAITSQPAGHKYGILILDSLEKKRKKNSHMRSLWAWYLSSHKSVKRIGFKCVTRQEIPSPLVDRLRMPQKTKSLEIQNKNKKCDQPELRPWLAD